ncbi:MAG TPA: hypothetical protein VFC73_05745 [Syntrophomonadaceae bacterium]|nr:hypothetical protein [Syntrophomonadaceae bacterium]
MRIRNLNNAPVFNELTAEIVGKVEKTVIGDDYKIAYLIVSINGSDAKMLNSEDFILADKVVVINDPDCIKSYLHGEELSIYEKKMGDMVFDKQGNELGVVSDFIICPETKQVCAVEISLGLLRDLWEGRKDLELANISWKSLYSGITGEKGSEVNGG